MSTSKLNEAKAYHFRERSQSPKNEVSMELLEEKGQKYNVNERHPNQSKSWANLKNNKTEDNLEKAESSQIEKIKSKEKSKNDSVSTNNRKKSSRKKSKKSAKIKDQKENTASKKISKKQTCQKTKSSDLVNESNDEFFEFEDIINNSRVLELVQDLVNSLTCNSTLPEKDLQALKESLFERACYAFLSILNNCVNKIYIRVLNSNFIRKLRAKPAQKKDACCQTFFPQFSEDRNEEIEIQEYIQVFP